MAQKFLAALLALLLFTGVARAQTCTSYPYTLTNGNTADASQVMANLGYVVTCLSRLSGVTSFNSRTGAVTPAATDYPAFMRSYLAGFTLSNDGGSPNTGLDIAAGAANDSSNTVTIMLSSVFTKSTAGAWVSGSSANGMGNGLTIAASTWYHVCLANNSGTPDIWFDTS